MNDETRWIFVGKSVRRFHPQEENEQTYFKFELNENGTANVRIPTLRNERNMNLEVNISHQYDNYSNFVSEKLIHLFVDFINFVQVKYMDEKSLLGYFYPLLESEPADLEAKILTKR